MKQLPSGSGGGLQDQFDCLVQALAMSTFALNLKRAGEAKSSDGGGRGGDGDGVTKGRREGGGEGRGRRPEKGRNKACSNVWNGASGINYREEQLQKTVSV